LRPIGRGGTAAAGRELRSGERVFLDKLDKIDKIDGIDGIDGIDEHPMSWESIKTATVPRKLEQ